MSDTPEYLERIKSLSGDKDFIAVQRESAAILSTLISGIPEAELARRPAPGKWSVAEILAHLAEDELVTHWRYRQMIETDGVPLSGFDQDLWARLGDYRSRSPAQSLTLFNLLRDANLHMLASLTPQEWQRSGIHSERGPITVESLARHMAGHDLNHLAQIRKILGK